MIENSSGVFRQAGDHYIHHFKQTSDTGLKLDLIQEYIFITLDVFREITHNISAELDAWMYFLSSDHPADIMSVIEAYPYFKGLYSDMIKFQRKPKELVNMFSEALAIMDRNTVKYMMEDREEKIRQLSIENEQQAGKIELQAGEIGLQANKIEQLASENEQLSKKIDELTKRLDSLESQHK